MNSFEMPKLVIARFSTENIITSSGEQNGFKIGNEPEVVPAGVIKLIGGTDEKVQKWNEILSFTQ